MLFPEVWLTVMNQTFLLCQFLHSMEVAILQNAWTCRSFSSGNMNTQDQESKQFILFDSEISKQYHMGKNPVVLNIRMSVSCVQARSLYSVSDWLTEWYKQTMLNIASALLERRSFNQSTRTNCCITCDSVMMCILWHFNCGPILYHVPLHLIITDD